MSSSTTEMNQSNNKTIFLVERLSQPAKITERFATKDRLESIVTAEVWVVKAMVRLMTTYDLPTDILEQMGVINSMIAKSDHASLSSTLAVIEQFNQFSDRNDSELLGRIELTTMELSSSPEGSVRHEVLASSQRMVAHQLETNRNLEENDPDPDDEEFEQLLEDDEREGFDPSDLV